MDTSDPLTLADMAQVSCSRPTPVGPEWRKGDNTVPRPRGL